MDAEIIIPNAIKDLDKKYLYFIDSNGNVNRTKKGSLPRKKGKKNKVFSELNLTIPRALVKAYISNKEKRVIAYGNSGAMISMPNWTIGMKGRVIILPSEAIKDIEENTINI